MKIFKKFFLLLSILVGLSLTVNAAEYDKINSEKLQNWLDFADNFDSSILKLNSIAFSLPVKYFIENKADPDTKARGYTSLSLAAATNNVELLDFLVAHGAHITSELSFKFALKCENKEVLVRIVNYGVDITTLKKYHIVSSRFNPWLETYDQKAKNIPNDEGSILHRAVRLKLNKDLKKILVKHHQKKSLNTLIEKLDDHGQTALDIALVTRNKEAILLLLSYGADPFKGLYEGLLLANHIPEWKELLNKEDPKSSSIYEKVYEGAQNHHLAIIKFLPLPDPVLLLIIDFVLK